MITVYISFRLTRALYSNHTDFNHIFIIEYFTRIVFTCALKTFFSFGDDGETYQATDIVVRLCRTPPPKKNGLRFLSAEE